MFKWFFGDVDALVVRYFYSVQILNRLQYNFYKFPNVIWCTEYALISNLFDCFVKEFLDMSKEFYLVRLDSLNEIYCNNLFYLKYCVNLQLHIIVGFFVMSS